MRYSILIILFLIQSVLLTNRSCASNGTSLKGARSAALGESGIALDGFWSAINNQAGLALLDKIHIGLSSENRFLIKDLSTYGLAFNIPTNNAGFGFNLIRFGSSSYNETTIGIAYGMKLGRNFCIGIQLNYLNLKQGNGFGSKSSYYIEGGFLYNINPKLKMLAHFFNPTFHSNKTLQLAEIYQMGFSYLVHKQVVFLMSYKFHSVWQFSIHTGIEFQFKSLRARLGYASKPEKFTFGLGYHYKRLQIDISSSIHSLLGNSPQLSLIYSF